MCGFHPVAYNKSLCALIIFQMQRLGTDEISQYTSVHQYQVEDASPGTHCLQASLLIPPASPGNRRWNWLQSYISPAGWGVYYYNTAREWQREKATEGKMAEWWEQWRGRGIKLAGEEERGGRREGGWIKEERELGAVCSVQGENCAMAAKVSACVFFYMHLCVSVHVFVLLL